MMVKAKPLSLLMRVKKFMENLCKFSQNKNQISINKYHLKNFIISHPENGMGQFDEFLSLNFIFVFVN